MNGPDAAPEGVLLVDKPAGPTSHDVVGLVRRALRTRRVGHTGTLDPFASGLMLICLGRATRIAEYLSGLDKAYSATVRLGVSTDTDDGTGRITAEADASAVTLADIERALARLRGPILQTPPPYSAKKLRGQRAYALARAGHAVELQPVSVTIHELWPMRYDPPVLELDVACSSGTYVRALARDLGAALGVGAHLTALRRTAVGAYTVARAVSVEALQDDPDAARSALIPTLHALGDMPRLDLSADDVDHIRHGRPITAPAAPHGTLALAADNELVAIADAADGVVRPRKVFL